MPLLRTLAVSRMLCCHRPATAILNSNAQQIHTTARFLSEKDHQSKHSQVIKKEKDKLRTYVAESYMKYLQNYTLALEKRFPAAMRMYRTFTIGIKEFYNDLKQYISLSMRVNKDDGFSQFSRQDIELYHKMPADMWRIAPVLILSAIPFGNYVVFPLAYLKPRKLLCSHFWSSQQRVEFSILELKERLRHYTPVFRALQTKVHVITDLDLKVDWMKIVAKIDNGSHPSCEEVIRCKKLFESGPFNLSDIPYQHAGHLLKMHGLRKGIFRSRKLRYRALIIKEMDKAIIREGGVKSLSSESLQNACQIRGLNSGNMSNKEMVAWLSKWIQISQIVDKKSYSLLLHCPILLAYNNPSNHNLIY